MNRSGIKRNLIARLRCENEEMENRYWIYEEKKKCRLCEEGRETIKHMATVVYGFKRKRTTK